MSTFRGVVYWREQCDFCATRGSCEYRDIAETFIERLCADESEAAGCYGTLSFWCDYYREDEEKARSYSRMNGVVMDG